MDEVGESQGPFVWTIEFVWTSVLFYLVLKVVLVRAWSFLLKEGHAVLMCKVAYFIMSI